MTTKGPTPLPPNQDLGGGELSDREKSLLARDVADHTQQLRHRSRFFNGVGIVIIAFYVALLGFIFFQPAPTVVVQQAVATPMADVRAAPPPATSPAPAPVSRVVAQSEPIQPRPFDPLRLAELIILASVPTALVLRLGSLVAPKEANFRPTDLMPLGSALEDLVRATIKWLSKKID